MSDDLLRDLAKDLPFERPDPSRRDAVRSALLVAANEEGARPPGRRRWMVVGTAFTAGVLAAAAVALVVIRDDEPQQVADLTSNAAQITASSEARLEHRVVATETGVDEIVQVHDGTVRLAVTGLRRGDHVRLRTRDAEVEGAGEYEAVVTAESLSAVTVRSGTAQIRITGQQTVLLAAGQTWRAAVITTDLSPAEPSKLAVTEPPVVPVTPVAPVAPTGPQPDVRAPDRAVRAPDPAVRTVDQAVRSPDVSVRAPDIAVAPRPATSNVATRPAGPAPRSSQRRCPARMLPSRAPTRRRATRSPR